MPHVIRNQDVAEPRDVPAHSESMTVEREVSMPRKVKSHSMQTSVPGFVTEIRNPFRGLFGVPGRTDGPRLHRFRMAQTVAAECKPYGRSD